ncbi:MAG: aminomethyl-transferring glycine dehydrogenase subunit GcvPA [Deltaproteobacteria bacterium]|nr:MAG: aminomethyl-transferring glycine dehydrogenase subunit GcvPA [Deltaproteobacteria bacterium]
MRYLPHTEAEIAEMLAAIGKESIDDLFHSIPAELRLREPLKLPPALDERALTEHITSLSADTGGRPFLGAGCYPHHVPAVVSQILLRGELLTAYTPYQPECSQGTLQIIFEYQTMVCALAGLEVANASMYDGAHALAEAALMALRLKRRARRILVSEAIHPEYREVLATYLAHGEAEVIPVPFGEDGATDLSALEEALTDDTACVVAGYPNFFGVVEPIDRIAELAHAKGTLAVSVTTEAVALGLLAPPGRLGVDIAVGELGSFGNAMSLGGPQVGFFASKASALRQLPGRLCGATVDRQGRRGFVLTLSTREQHIRRAKATSNICTNQGLAATAATVHLALLGRHGIRELARLNYLRARYAREKLAERGVRLAFTGPTFNEFVAEVEDPHAAVRRIEEAGLEGGLPLDRFFPEGRLCRGLHLCVTEVHEPEEIERLAAAVGGLP